MGMQPDGRELLVVAIKGTFTIPENGEEPDSRKSKSRCSRQTSSRENRGFQHHCMKVTTHHVSPVAMCFLMAVRTPPVVSLPNECVFPCRSAPSPNPIDVVGNRVWKKRLFFVRAS